jgi:hypothetical protein
MPEKIARLTLCRFSREVPWALRQPKPAPKVVTFGIRYLKTPPALSVKLSVKGVAE